MQIEFERLVQLANPDFEYQNKLDSDTIFYFINATQERFLKECVSKSNSAEKGSAQYNRLIDSYKALVTNKTLFTKTDDLEYNNSCMFKLPSDITDKFFIYLSSYSNIIDLSDNNTKKANNTLISPADIPSVITTNINKPILRNPCVVLYSAHDGSSLTVFYDNYTDLLSCNITYIRKPLDVNVISSDTTTTECELDSNVHREIVELAVDMFITEGAYRLNAKANNKQTNNDQQ